MFNITPVVRNIIFICVAVLIADSIFARMNVMGYLALYKINSGFWKPYQMFTYMFAHGGFGHLFFNMLALMMFGSNLEMMWGPQKFLLYYIAATIGAALIYLGLEFVFKGPDPVPMVGASGAIYALLAAYGVLMPEREMNLIIPPIAVKAKYFVFVVGFFAFLVDKSGTVAHFAHLGGAVIGIFMLKVLKF